MKLHNGSTSFFIPDGKPEGEALSRVTHLGIGAHQDDLEFMASHGILNCFARDDQWFGGVTCTNGAGSSRSGPYAAFTDEGMMAIRRQEQNTAATVGSFGAMIQLDYLAKPTSHGPVTPLHRQRRHALPRLHPPSLRQPRRPRPQNPKSGKWVSSPGNRPDLDPHFPQGRRNLRSLKIPLSSKIDDTG
jgi:hypothetical protein